MFGQIENGQYITVSGKQSRRGNFVAKVFGPTSDRYNDPDAIQETFVQQRGFKENRLGETADIRALQENGVLDKPITEPKEVSKKGDDTNAGSSFYGDE